MARIRSIKPEFFKHEGLQAAEAKTGLPLRLAFIGLWTLADREGRFRWRPRVIATDLFPFDGYDMAAILDALLAAGFVERYEVAGEVYGCIPTFLKHQRPHPHEAKSTLPCREMSRQVMTSPDFSTAGTESGSGKGRERGLEGKGAGEGKAEPGRAGPGGPAPGPETDGAGREIPQAVIPPDSGSAFGIVPGETPEGRQARVIAFFQSRPRRAGAS